MPYRNRRFSNKTPIHSIKHVLDNQGVLAAGVQTFVGAVLSVDAPVLTNNQEVEVGSRVNSMFVNVQVIGDAASGILNNVYAFWFKNPGGNIAGAAIPNGNVTGASDFKRQIFHTEMLMLGSEVSAIPQSLFKGVIRIPKHMQSMRINDSIELQLFAPGAIVNFCVQTIYKEYR